MQRDKTYIVQYNGNAWLLQSSIDKIMVLDDLLKDGKTRFTVVSHMLDIEDDKPQYLQYNEANINYLQKLLEVSGYTDKIYQTLLLEILDDGLFVFDPEIYQGHFSEENQLSFQLKSLLEADNPGYSPSNKPTFIFNTSESDSYMMERDLYHRQKKGKREKYEKQEKPHKETDDPLFTKLQRAKAEYKRLVNTKTTYQSLLVSMNYKIYSTQKMIVVLQNACYRSQQEQ
jgi:hypothetical protein